MKMYKNKNFYKRIICFLAGFSFLFLCILGGRVVWAELEPGEPSVSPSSSPTPTTEPTVMPTLTPAPEPSPTPVPTMVPLPTPLPVAPGHKEFGVFSGNDFGQVSSITAGEQGFIHIPIEGRGLFNESNTDTILALDDSSSMSESWTSYRTAFSYEGANSSIRLAPSLTIVWSDDQSWVANSPVSSSDDAEQYSDGSVNITSIDLDLGTYWSGIRFSSIDIPRGATIHQAFLRFFADADQSGTCQFRVYGEKSAYPRSFSTSYYDLTYRTRTNAYVDMTIYESWSRGRDYYLGYFNSMAVTNIVREIINLSSWSSGNDMVLLFSPSGGLRSARSWDNSSSLGCTDCPPILSVDYEGGHVDRVLSSATFDSEENPSEQFAGWTYNNSIDLDLGQSHVGMMFSNLGIPQGVTINSAYVSFMPYETSWGYDFNGIQIFGEDTSSPQPYNSSGSYIFEITNRLKTDAYVNWLTEQHWDSDWFQGGSTRFNSPDITSVVQEIVNRGDWGVSGHDDMSLLFLTNEMSPKIKSAEVGAQSFVDYLDASYDRVGVLSFAHTPSRSDVVWEIGLTSNFSSVKNAIGNIDSPAGGTPLASGLSEAIDELQNNGRSDARHYIVLLTDGRNTYPYTWENYYEASTLRSAYPDFRSVYDKLIASDIVVFTIGQGWDVQEGPLQVLSEDSGGEYFFAQNEFALVEIYEQIAGRINQSYTVEFNDVINASYLDIDGSVQVPLCSVDGVCVIDENGVEVSHSLIVEGALVSGVVGNIPVGEVWDVYIPVRVKDSCSGSFEADVEYVADCQQVSLAQDTYISEDPALSDVCDGESSHLFVGEVDGFQRSSFIQFDFTGLSRRVVESAHFNFYQQTTEVSPSLNLFQNTSNWAESGATCVSGDNRPEHQTSPFDSFSYTGSYSGWHQIEMTHLVDSWLHGLVENYGFAMESAGGSNFSRITSKESGSGNEPYLDICFSNQNEIVYRDSATGSLISSIDIPNVEISCFSLTPTPTPTPIPSPTPVAPTASAWMSSLDGNVYSQSNVNLVIPEDNYLIFSSQSDTGGVGIASDSFIQPSFDQRSQRGWYFDSYSMNTSVMGLDYSSLQLKYGYDEATEITTLDDSQINQSGVYKFTGESVLVSDLTAMSFGNVSAVIFVDGNLNLNGNFAQPPFVQSGSNLSDQLDLVLDQQSGFSPSFMFIINGDLHIDPTVQSVYGVYFVGGDIHTGNSSNPLYLYGQVAGILNSLGQQNNFFFERNLGNDNEFLPGELFVFMPRYYFTLSDLIGETTISWLETAD